VRCTFFCHATVTTEWGSCFRPIILRCRPTWVWPVKMPMTSLRVCLGRASRSLSRLRHLPEIKLNGLWTVCFCLQELKHVLSIEGKVLRQNHSSVWHAVRNVVFYLFSVKLCVCVCYKMLCKCVHILLCRLPIGRNKGLSICLSVILSILAPKSKT